MKRTVKYLFLAAFGLMVMNGGGDAQATGAEKLLDWASVPHGPKSVCLVIDKDTQCTRTGLVLTPKEKSWTFIPDPSTQRILNKRCRGKTLKDLYYLYYWVEAENDFAHPVTCKGKKYQIKAGNKLMVRLTLQMTGATKLDDISDDEDLGISGCTWVATGAQTITKRELIDNAQGAIDAGNVYNDFLG